MDDPRTRATRATRATSSPDPLASATHAWDLGGTTARLVVTDAVVLDEAVALTQGLLDQVDRAASRLREDSEVRTLQRGDDGTALVSPLLAELVQEAVDVARATDGAVDPTIGTARPMTVVRRVPGWRALGLDGLRLTLPAGLELDLGATAPAYAADRAAALVAARLGTGVLVGLGGDLATAGPAPRGGWQIRVQGTEADPVSLVSLPAGSAMATSSTVRHPWLRGARPTYPLVDPVRGVPAARVWRSVTVAAASCAAASAASTATIVKGPAGLDWLARQHLPARLVDRGGVARFAGGWPADTAA